MKFRLLFCTLVIFVILISGCVRKFTITPYMKEYDFSVVDNYGTLQYIPIADARSDFDKEGKVETSCSGGTAGITHLGDKNYKNPLLTEFNKHLINALQNSRLFSQLTEETTNNTTYQFSSILEKYHVTLDEVKARQTQACIGGLIGAAIASAVDVAATTDIQLTGILSKNNEEIWRHTITKQVIERDDYGKTRQNTERSMGEAIGEACKDLVTEMAVYLSSQ